jgi:hypothetical protein
MQMASFGYVDGIEYLRCPESGSIFLAQLPNSLEWAWLLMDVSQYRHSPVAFHSEITKLRSDNVYVPKLEWIHNTFRLQGLHQPRLLEVFTPPSDFTALLKDSGLFAEVTTVSEMDLVRANATGGQIAEGWSVNGSGGGEIEAAVLLESLDRVDDPAALLRAVSQRLADGGLVFVTALVCSGFDVALLGLHNLYIYPPDRTNCFSLRGLELLLSRAGFTLLEVSTPGVLDVEIVRAHLRHDPAIPLSTFERQLLDSHDETREAFQEFLQQSRLSSFARIVGRKQQ